MRQFLVRVNGEEFQVEIEEVGGTKVAAPVVKQQPVAAAPAVKVAKPAAAQVIGHNITAPMPGTVLNVKVKVGDQVKNGDVVLILEAMKLENNLITSVNGKIKAVHVETGSSVNAGDLLVEIEE